MRVAGLRLRLHEERDRGGVLRRVRGCCRELLAEDVPAAALLRQSDQDPLLRDHRGVVEAALASASFTGHFSYTITTLGFPFPSRYLCSSDVRSSVDRLRP